MKDNNFDKEMFEYFRTNKDVPQETINSIYKLNLSQRTNPITFDIKKVAIIIIGLVTMSTGVVFANDITDFIKSLFNDSKGVDTATENGYVHKVPEEIYCESKGVISRAKELIMDDYSLNINMMITLDEDIDITAFEKMRIPDLKIYDDTNQVLFKNVNATVEDNVENYINSSCSIFIDNADKNIIHYTINISTDDEKLPKSKNLFIDFNSIEIEKDNKKYVITGKWSNKIEVPQKFYNRASKILKANSCNNDKVYKDSLHAEVTETCTKFALSMYWGNYEEEVKKSEELRQNNVNASLFIKDNAFIETDNGNKFYASHTSDVDGGYSLDRNGNLNYWETFNLTKFDLKGVKSLKVVIETWNGEETVIEFNV